LGRGDAVRDFQASKGISCVKDDVATVPLGTGLPRQEERQAEQALDLGEEATVGLREGPKEGGVEGGRGGGREGWKGRRWVET
jgi:hypothetical protein